MTRRAWGGSVAGGDAITHGADLLSRTRSQPSKPTSISERWRSLAALAIAALVLSGCGGDKSPQPSDQEASKPSSSAITFPLKEENGSGQSGEAIARPEGDSGMGLLLKLRDGSGQNPAHIHDVTCGQYRGMNSFNDQLGTVENTLETLHDGQSDSTLSGVSLSSRTTGEYSVNVHEPAHPYKVVACGDIPRR